MAKVLLIEDDEGILNLYRRLFSLEKLDLVTADNGIDGIMKAKALMPDLILLDIMMPQMNGLDALQQLKSDATTHHIPVVMLTNLSNDEQIQQALQLGAARYFVKSQHDPSVIATMVREILSTIPGQQASAAAQPAPEAPAPEAATPDAQAPAVPPPPPTN